MTQRPRRKITDRDTAPTNVDPFADSKTEQFGQYGQSMDETMDPHAQNLPYIPTSIQNRLNTLRDYAGPDGLIPVSVAVAHDAVFVGNSLRVPVTDRVAGLIEIGFLELEPQNPNTP